MNLSDIKKRCDVEIGRLSKAEDRTRAASERLCVLRHAFRVWEEGGGEGPSPKMEAWQEALREHRAAREAEEGVGVRIDLIREAQVSLAQGIDPITYLRSLGFGEES